jgi:protein involved in polysaccharide export with SLBB domain
MMLLTALFVVAPGVFSMTAAAADKGRSATAAAAPAPPQAAARQRPAPPAAEKAPSPAADEDPREQSPPAARLHLGDRLQIKFFEHLDLGQADSARTNPLMQTFYQRTDLSGEYRVDVHGTIAVPLLGKMTVQGRSLDELQDRIEAAFEDRTGRSGDVHITILERQPVYVMGVVRNPGSFSFVPGMIALQAIAHAGGFERLREGSGELLEARRERERAAQTRQRLKRLMAQRARLLAQRDGNLKPSDGSLLSLASADNKKDELLPAEMTLLEVETAALESAADFQDALLASAKGELEALRESVKLVGAQIKVRSERLRVLERAQGRGISSVENLWNAQKDLADFELQRKQLTTAIHAAEEKVAQAKLAKTQARLDRRAKLARDLMTVEDEIAQLEQTVAASEGIANAVEAAATVRGVGPDRAIRIEILRRTERGVRTFPAGESTDLMPGDVIKVGTQR